MLNRCSENYIETTSKEHVEIPTGKRRQKNFHFQPVCQHCFNATGHIGLTLNQRQNACRVSISDDDSLSEIACVCVCVVIGQYSLYFWLKDTSTTCKTSLIFMYVSVCL